MIKHVFLTGPPGVGKTTLIQQAAEALVSSGVTLEGFYTEEVREAGRRVGFDVVTLAGERAHLARIRGSAGGSAGGFSGGPSGGPTRRQEHLVGQYVVDLPSFESLALPLFKHVGPAGGNPGKVFVIDEIGKMELFSQAFIRAVRQTLDSCSILGTIPLSRGRPLALVEEVRARRDVRVFTVSKENRGVILKDIVSAVQDTLKQSA